VISFRIVRTVACSIPRFNSSNVELISSLKSTISLESDPQQVNVYIGVSVLICLVPLIVSRRYEIMNAFSSSLLSSLNFCCMLMIILLVIS
jgi:hypothetical protein